MTLHLTVFDPDPETVASLNHVFGDLESITIISVDTMLYLQPPKGLDILYLPLAAAERFGARPLIHKSQIISISPVDQAAGLPALIVTGTCLDADDARGPVPEMRILLTSVFDAIRTLNHHKETRPINIGFWAYNLLSGLTPSQLKGILIDIVPELR